MIARNCTIADLYRALEAVNKYYAGNVTFRKIEPKRKRIRFTLQTVSSKAPGHIRVPGKPRNGITPDKRLPYACWHVHGHFFEELFKVAPEAGVYSSVCLANPERGCWITRKGGNWQDRNVGSEMYPRLASEACDCGQEPN